MTQLKEGDTIRLTGSSWNNQILDDRRTCSSMLHRIYEVYTNCKGNLGFVDEDDDAWDDELLGAEGYEFEVVDEVVTEKEANVTQFKKYDEVKLTGKSWADINMLNQVHLITHFDEDGDAVIATGDTVYGTASDDTDYSATLVESRPTSHEDVCEEAEVSQPAASGAIHILQKVFAVLGKGDVDSYALRAYIEGALNMQGIDVE